MAKTNQPIHWFDQWGKDSRDNTLNNLIDDQDLREKGFKDSIGLNFMGDCADRGGIDPVTRRGAYGVICTLGSNKVTNVGACKEDRNREKRKVCYWVCANVPKAAYKKASITFPRRETHVQTIMGWIKKNARRKPPQWKVLKDNGVSKPDFNGQILSGDFVAYAYGEEGEGHSGIALNGTKIVHIPGFGTQNTAPSVRNDMKDVPRSAFFRGNPEFIARPIETPARPPAGRKYTCVPWTDFLTVAHARGLTEEGPLPPSDLVGLQREDGITYGTWDRRPRVRRLQQKLSARGAALDIDGMLGEETAIALRQYQGRMGLPEQDRVDPATARTLEGYGPEPRDLAPISQIEGLKRGDGIVFGTWDRRPRVRILQQRLTARGYVCVVDGMFGPKTTKALQGFQVGNGLPPTEVVDRPTADALEGGGVVPACPPGTIPV